MPKKNIILFIFTIYFFTPKYFIAQQNGGMWIPNQLNEKEMKQLGMKISAKQIFDSENPSIKDAVAHFGGGCTSEVISPKGLLLTNYHCGYSAIQTHSTLENNLLDNGFWAENFEEELPNENLTATFTIDIKDVTTDVLKNITDNLTEKERGDLIQLNIKEVTQSIPIEDYQSIDVVPFYTGNQYYAFIKETYEDVRLVGTPPSSIGKFGSDTDNWVWPRHTGDFAIFRIYADKNNKPAKYSKNNIPFTPKYYLPISIKEKHEGDFSFVFGFPGMTDEYLPSMALTEILESINPARISTREATLKILDDAMRTNKETKIKYASKYAAIANGWKKWIGESQGLEKSKAVEERINYEKEFTKYVNSTELNKTKYKNLLPELEKIYKINERYARSDTYFNEVFYFNSETFKMAINLINSIRYSQNFEDTKTKLKSNIAGIYKNYNADLDGKVTANLMSIYALKVEPRFQISGHEDFERVESSQDKINEMWNNSIITGKKGGLLELLSSSDNENIIKTLFNDPVINFVNSYYEVYINRIIPEYRVNNQKLDSLQRIYMKAQMEAFPNRTLFPDANSTLRVSYGKIDGYSPKDAVHYTPFTTLDGVIEKYIPEDYEFDVSQKLIDLYNKKDFGSYTQDAVIPVNYIATNHTTGGNSGSPAFDAYGNLVGLNFDRVWEGTMSDLNYDPEICRNIMVDSRYILFVIDKYANAQRIIKELKIIR